MNTPSELVPLDTFAHYGALLVEARKQAQAEIDAAAEDAGFRHRGAIRRGLRRLLDRYLDAPLGVQYACFAGAIAILVLTFRMPPAWPVRAVELALICFPAVVWLVHAA